jgi:transposase InsO family protein
MAHPSNEVMKKGGKFIKDFPSVQIPTEHICPGCAQGKMTNKSFPPSSERANEPFELIHSDLKSFPIESYRKYKYTIVFYDDYSSNAWTINLRTKDAALPATKHFIAMVENQYNGKIRKWMSDAGGEYTSKAFTQMLNDKGIKILQSIPYAHQQNGRAERIIRTLMEKAETMRLQACLPQSYWEFALDHATHVYNRTPQRRLHWQTPSEWLINIRPTVDHL